MKPTPANAEYSIGFLAGRFQCAVQLLREIFAELEIEPCRHSNDVPFFDGAAQDRLRDYVAEARTKRDEVRQ